MAARDSNPPATAAASADASTGRWRALWTLSAVRLAMGYQFQLVGSAAPVLRDEYGLDLAQIGWLVGLYSLVGIVVALPGGMLGARWGDKRVAGFGLLMMVIGGAAMAAADDWTLLQVGRLLAGGGSVIFNVSASKMVTDWFAGREMVLAMSMFASTWPIGIGFGLLTLGAVAQQHSAAHAAAVTAGVAAVAFMGLLVAYRTPPTVAQVARPKLSALDAWEWRIVVFGGAAWSIYNVGFALMVGFMPTLFAARGVSLGSAGAIIGFACTTITVSIWFAGWLVQRTGRPRTVAVAGLLIWAAALVAMLTLDWPQLWLAIGGLAAGMATGVLVAVPGRVLRPASRGAGMGVFYTVYYVGMALLPGAAGAFAKSMGDVVWTVWAAVACVLVTLAMMSAVEWSIARRAAGATR